jgi:hypothetical protein
VDEDGTETLGVVGLEALDHELDGVVVLWWRSAWGIREEREDRKRTMFAMEKPVMSNTMVWKGQHAVPRSVTEG